MKTTKKNLRLRRIVLIYILYISCNFSSIAKPANYSSDAEAIPELINHLACSPDSLATGKYVIPSKPEDIIPLLIGASIPKVVLTDAGGKKFDLNEAVRSKPVILIFYRGGWCPYCSKQLSGLQLIENDLTKMGYQIIAVSTDSPQNLSKTLGKEKLTYTLLSDADLNLSKKFGIAFKAPTAYDNILPEASGMKNADKLLPVPSVFILNTEGTIRFEYINPDIKERISPELLKAAAAAALVNR